MNQVIEEHASRRAFLRSALKTLAAAIGMAALPGVVRAARPVRGKAGSIPDTPDSVSYICYANAEHCGTGCNSGKVKYHCVSTTCSNYCTSCQPFSTYQESYTVVQPICG